MDISLSSVENWAQKDADEVTRSSRLQTFLRWAKARCRSTGRARLGRLAVAHRIKEEFQWCQLTRFNECERSAVLKVPVW